MDLKKWNESFLEHHTVIAEYDSGIIGFGDMDDSGYFDRLFVRKDYQRNGIATAICDELKSSVTEK